MGMGFMMFLGGFEHLMALIGVVSIAMWIFKATRWFYKGPNR